MRVLLYQGGAQYNALNRFSEQLGEGLKKIGHQVEIINLLEADKNRDLLINALANKPNLVIGFNGMGSDIRMKDNRSVYEVAECGYLQLLLDHPAFHEARLVKSPANAITGVVDITHLDYLGKTRPRHSAFFAPHGGIQSPDFKTTDRPIDILFTGTGMDPEKERKSWNQFPHAYRSILQEAFDEFLKEPRAWDLLIATAAARHRVHLPTHLMTSMIVQLEIVMRAEFRLRVFKAFDKAGLPITIMGNGWEFAKFKHHEIKPSVEYYESLKLTCQAKFSLNASPQFFNGSHERVFVAMLNGAVPITTESLYYAEHFVSGQHYLPYHLDTLPHVLEDLKALMVSKTKLKDVRHEALTIAQRDHTWTKRAEEFMDKFETLGITEMIYRKQFTVKA